MPNKDISYAKRRGRMTAYDFFVQTCREEHKKKHPEENAVLFAEFSGKCAERWRKTIKDQEKAIFQDMADRDKMLPPAGAGKGRGKKGKKFKDPNAPKRPLSAFFLFSGDRRQGVKDENPEFGIGDVAKELGKMWREGDAETKRKYQLQAEQGKHRYEREMAAYKAVIRHYSKMYGDEARPTKSKSTRRADEGFISYMHEEMDVEEEDEEEDDELRGARLLELFVRDR